MRLLSLALCLSVLLPQPTNAQTPELDRIQMSVIVSPRTADAMGSELSALERAIEGALAAEGMGTALPGMETRFVAYIDLVPLQEEMIPGGMTAVNQQLTITFGDQQGGVAIGQFVHEAKSVGKSKQVALRNLSTSLRLSQNKQWKATLAAANQGIINHFERQCSALLGEAKALVKQQNFDQAILLTTTVPREARACHEQSQAYAGEAYTTKLRMLCAGPVAKARAKWVASKTRASAEEVADILGTIPADSPCFKEVEALLGNVANVIQQYDAQAAQARRDQVAWQRKQYENRLAMARKAQSDQVSLQRDAMRADQRARADEMAFRRETLKAEQTVALAAIAGARDVGVEAAKASSSKGSSRKKALFWK